MDGQPYVWSTEFENVHSLWRYREPSLHINGSSYPCSEDFYHAQKPIPFNASEWDTQKVAVMRKAVHAKLAADPSLVPLLLATGSHPLLALKNDTFWGFHPRYGGENMLAKLWEELRASLLAKSKQANDRKEDDDEEAEDEETVFLNLSTSTATSTT